MKTILPIDEEQRYALFNRILSTQADMLGLNDVFWISSIIFLCLIPLVWLTRPVGGAASASAAAGAH
ncbi:hypothetical protein [Legionella genomosp. 1]|uniref:hypothetical protein n=1 Tax=Legionella genomosp. 1 TaxID=1093625 RepID=UPI00105670AE|nr:hypothetical protein [Legionella genomosp. 1]